MERKETAQRQPGRTEERFCLQRTRRRLTGLFPAALLLAGGALCLYFFYLGQTPSRGGGTPGRSDAHLLPSVSVFGSWGRFDRPVSGLPEPAGYPAPGEERSGPVHPGPAALPRRGAPGERALRHGGPGPPGKRPVVRQTGHREGVGAGGSGLPHPPHPGGIQPVGAAHPPRRQAHHRHLSLRGLDRGRPAGAAGHRSAQPAGAGRRHGLPAPARPPPRSLGHTTPGSTTT